MRVENVDAAFYSGATGGTSEERLIEQRAGRMQSNSSHQDSPRDLLKLGRSGNRSEREIRGADFGRTIRMKSKHAAIGGSSQIRCRSIGWRSDELIRGAGIPDGEGTG